ncbi:unnamed protein product, partial [Effrenium voratum]
RREMRRLDEAIGVAGPEEAVKLCQRLLQLYDQEGLHLQALRGRACLDACGAFAALREEQQARRNGYGWLFAKG